MLKQIPFSWKFASCYSRRRCDCGRSNDKWVCFGASDRRDNGTAPRVIERVLDMDLPAYLSRRFRSHTN